MDSFLDKLGVYDFFNLIGAGGVLLGGMHVIGIIELKRLNDYLDCENGVLNVAMFLGLCFLLGTVLQQVGVKICKGHYKKQLLNELLSDTSTVINNKFKQKEHLIRANNLLYNLGIAGKDFDIESRFEYYFSYCENSIHVYGKDGKTERMRNLRGLTSALVACFSILFLMSIIKILATILCFYIPGVSHTFGLIGVCIDLLNLVSGGKYFAFLLMCSICFAGMTRLNQMSYKNNTLFWMQMVLDVYMASTDRNNNCIISKDD